MELSEEKIKQYFNRLNLNYSAQLNIELLNALHQSHLSHIPYENFDIMNKLHFNLSIDKLFAKIITNKRGGYCYELNILFFILLKSLGFKARLLAAQIISKGGEIGDYFDHPLIIVELERDWLLDVGNTKWFTSPLLLPHILDIDSNASAFTIQFENDKFILYQKTEDIDVPCYQFNLNEVKPLDFVTICQKKWTTPNSKYTKHYIISKFANGQRITLRNDLMTHLSGSIQINTPIFDKNEFKNFVSEHFGNHFSKLVLNYK